MLISKRSTLLWILILIFLISGCNQLSESDTLLKHKDIDTALPRHTFTKWILFRGENDSESLDYISNLNDPSGNSYVRINDIIHVLYMHEHDSYPENELYLGRISEDGNSIALIREGTELDHKVVKIFDLSTKRKINEFNLKNEDIAISPDLQTYVYAVQDTANAGIYQFDGGSKVLKKLDKDADGMSIYDLYPYEKSAADLQDHNVMKRMGITFSPVQTFDSKVDLMQYRQSIPIASIKASSSLADQSGHSYRPENLIDGDMRTGWCEGAKGDGIGESITINFGKEQMISGMELVNGLATSEKAYKANNRVKKIKLEFSDGRVLTLDTYFMEQYFDIPITASSVQMTILEVDPGEKYHDTCMTRLRFF
ncbi:discoidin domain-containing protein [Paenibacillus bovis]|uniref:F5/8 type C domain-containing protein n=1 Tax=Paenibacillus bovis TaxID=1616788 RepID=A0A172ZCA8_9BACL|nr:discoidin domain-containing protein [Paenibacillus bovis]ANF94907.1 hypothetical protein AR543_01905 [Paenibacillus bovis]